MICKTNGNCGFRKVQGLEPLDLCCRQCELAENCVDKCNAYDPANCGEDAEQTTDVTLFSQKALTLMKGIAELDKAKKALDAEDAELRTKLEAAMEEFGIKKFDNEILSITYVEPTFRTTVDGKKLEQELPDIYKKYAKTSPVKGSVRIKVK